MTNTNDYRINWRRLSITQEGEGTIIHPLIALALSPIMGLAFLMFLPFIGFYLSAQALSRLVSQTVRSVFESAALEPTPGAAHLTGNEPADKLQDDTALEELDKEIQAHRHR